MVPSSWNWTQQNPKNLLYCLATESNIQGSLQHDGECLLGIQMALFLILKEKKNQQKCWLTKEIKEPLTGDLLLFSLFTSTKEVAIFCILLLSFVILSVETEDDPRQKYFQFYFHYSEKHTLYMHFNLTAKITISLLYGQQKWTQH